MAVLELVPGITAEVHVNRQPVTEHDDVDEIQSQHPDAAIARYQELRTVSKYIESITDASFTIVVSVAPPYPSKMDCAKLGFHITVDGIPAWTSICGRPKYEREGEWMDTVAGIKEGKGIGCTMKEFRFAKIETNSDTPEATRVRRLAQRLAKVGTIEIKVYRESYGKRGGPTEGTSEGFLGRHGQEVPERALKGDVKSHGTALGRPRRVKRGDVWRDLDKKDGEDHPLVIFRFMYRSQEALKQMHIIARTPSPSPSASPSPEPEEEGIEGLTAEQQRQIAVLMRQFSSENRSRASGSREGESSSRRQRRIKQEHIEGSGGVKGGNRVKRARRRERVEVDLTGDDDEDEDEDGMFVD